MTSFLSIIKPNRQNFLIWIQLLLFLFLILSGKIDAINFVLLYFIESIIIGIFHFLFLLKMDSFLKSKENEKNFTAVFFFIHYLFFIFIQSIFVFVIVSNKLPEIKEPFHLWENLLIVLKRKGILILIAVVFITQLVKFLYKTMNTEFYRKYAISEIMMQPYPRVIIQQFVVIISMFFVVLTQAIITTALLLIIFVGLIDLLWSGLKNNTYFTKKLANYLKTKNQTEEEVENMLDLFLNS